MNSDLAGARTSPAPLDYAAVPTDGALSPADAWTIQRVLQWSTGFLRDRQSESPRLDAELLLAHALGCTRIQLYTSYDKPLLVEEREPFKQFLKRRVAGEPVAYITGVKEFMSLAFAVSPAVLIPRPDTEVLVERALDEAKRLGGAVSILLDVGTGSGCIAVALAKRLPAAQVSAWDWSAAALAVAQANALRHGGERIAFAQVDALSDAAWTGAGRFDLIVSNPPDISEAERADLPVSVVGYEPGSALFAADDGRAFYRRFAASARALLAPGGALLVEIGGTQAAAVARLLVDAGWAEPTVVKDYNKHDRVLIARA